MAERLLRISKDGALELDGTAVTLEEYEEVLKQDDAAGDDTPIEVHVPIFTSDKSPVGQVFQKLLELADFYHHPVNMMMGHSE
ncbi:MAG: hypothetical protein AAF697_09480 [Pseudomonadota bacterium]